MNLIQYLEILSWNKKMISYNLAFYSSCNYFEIIMDFFKEEKLSKYIFPNSKNCSIV